METKRNEKVAYETPVIETVELNVEGMLCDSPGTGSGDAGSDGWDD